MGETCLICGRPGCLVSLGVAVKHELRAECYRLSYERSQAALAAARRATWDEAYDLIREERDNCERNSNEALTLNGLLTLVKIKLKFLAAPADGEEGKR